MNKKRVQRTENEYGFIPQPITPQMQAVITHSQSPLRINPAIQGAFGQAARDVQNTYNDPMGAGTHPAVREKALRSNLMQLAAEKGKAMNEGYFEADQAKFGQKLAAAEGTQHQLVNKGQTVTQPGSGFLGVLGKIGTTALAF